MSKKRDELVQSVILESGVVVQAINTFFPSAQMPNTGCWGWRLAATRKDGYTYVLDGGLRRWEKIVNFHEVAERDEARHVGQKLPLDDVDSGVIE
jgi:hypothetical protein